MEPLKHAIETLRRAEADLQDMVSKAAASGDYAAVVQIASWAQAVSDLVGKKPAAHASVANLGSTNGGVAVRARAKHSSKKKTDDYPRFFRRGNELVRVAWSRRAKNEYQHKSSEAVLTKLADTLTKVGVGGRLFSTDEVLPLQEADGNEVPAYQAYVCIAFLKLAGLIEQHGRQGYSIPNPNDFVDAVHA